MRKAPLARAGRMIVSLVIGVSLVLCTVFFTAHWAHFPHPTTICCVCRPPAPQVCQCLVVPRRLDAPHVGGAENETRARAGPCDRASARTAGAPAPGP